MAAQRLRRVGLLGLKLGMSQTWDKAGKRIPLTALQVLDNQAVLVRTMAKDGLNAVQVGAVNHSKPHKLLKSERNNFASVDVPAKRHLREFPVSEDALVAPGTPLSVAHFLPGQFIDVIANTVGKGFQGVMRRHNMKGMSRSHGQTKTHRKMGASGGGTNPGRVLLGKRMAGHMGDVRVQALNLLVFRIDTRWNVLFVKGCVPGHKNTLVDLRDAWRKPTVLAVKPPVPTAAPDLLPPGVYTVGDALPLNANPASIPRPATATATAHA